MSDSNDPTPESNAQDGQDMQRLIDELLLPYARQVSGRKRDRVDLQPESLIASVIMDHLDEAQRASDGSTTAAYNLKGAIRHKFLDRLRKGGKSGQAVQFSQGDGSGPDPSANQSGPLTIVTDADNQRVADECAEHFRETVFGACSDEKDHVVIEGYVFAGEGWPAIADRADLSEAAARKRMSRLRGEVLGRVLEPIRERLSAEAWAVADGALIKRQPIEVLATTLGLSDDKIDRIMMSIVTDHLAQQYGTGSIEPIGRLLPRRKK